MEDTFPIFPTDGRLSRHAAPKKEQTAKEKEPKNPEVLAKMTLLLACLLCRGFAALSSGL